MCGKEKVGRTRGVLGLRNDTMVSSLDFLSASQVCQKGLPPPPRWTHQGNLPKKPSMNGYHTGQGMDNGGLEGQK